MKEEMNPSSSANAQAVTAKVPVEPTAQMLEAAHIAYIESDDAQWDAFAKAIYRAMLAAAPSPGEHVHVRNGERVTCESVGCNGNEEPK